MVPEDKPGEYHQHHHPKLIDMSTKHLIESREIGNYRVSIYSDFEAGCPLTEWDMGGRYLWEYSDLHCLSDSCNWKDWFYENKGHTLEEALQRIAARHVKQKDIISYYKAGKVDGVRLLYNPHSHEWELQTRCDWGTHKGEWFVDDTFEPYQLKTEDYCDELVECLSVDDLIALISDCADDFVIKRWSSCGYCQGDYITGIAYMSKERFDKHCGFNPQKFKDWKEQALHIIDLEVKEVGMWMWGDVKGYVLEKKVTFTKVYADEELEDEEDMEWEEVYSCWGYYMETEELFAEVIAEHGLV